MESIVSGGDTKPFNVQRRIDHLIEVSEMAGEMLREIDRRGEAGLLLNTSWRATRSSLGPD
jgi:hypothetical protein